MSETFRGIEKLLLRPGWSAFLTPKCQNDSLESNCSSFLSSNSLPIMINVASLKSQNFSSIRKAHLKISLILIAESPSRHPLLSHCVPVALVPLVLRLGEPDLPQMLDQLVVSSRL